jgi:predicted dehydrogenase
MGSVADKKKARVGVIGLGMGKHHVRNYQRYERSRVVAICDINRSLLEDVAEECSIPNAYTDVDEMLDAPLDLDGVSVALPNYLHGPVAIKALDRGINVLCEKPMAMNAKQAGEMVSAARRRKKKLMINFVYRFIDHCVALKELIEKGAIGDIYYCKTIWHRRRGGIPKPGSWFGIRSLSGGGPLIDLGVHRLDLALWLMGYPRAVSVSASTYEHLGCRFASEAGLEFDVEDLAAAFIRLQNGATLILETSWDGYSEKKEDMVTQIYGTKGGVIQRNVGEGYDFEAKMFKEEDGILMESRMLGAGKKRSKNPMEHFVDCILDDQEPIATGEQGFECMRIIDAIYLSAKTGREILLSP